MPRVNDPGALFPFAESKPISVMDAWENIIDNDVPPPVSNFLREIVPLMRQGQSADDVAHKGGFQTQRAHADRPSPTVTKIIAGMGFSAAIHPFENRIYSLAELRRVGSFPDPFKFIGRYSLVKARIGNSVPPLFMRSIAMRIKAVAFDGECKTMNKLQKVDYVPFLAKCWRDHLKKKPSDAPTVISTFAGCGGSSLGYSMAGFRELLAVEWDDNAVATFKLNFPHVPVYHGDIKNLTVKEVLKMTGLKVGELDVFDGSPPCQGFSTAGKRQLNDPRNQLFREYVRLLIGLRPKVFVMENVAGMVKGVMKFLFVEILKELKSCGYQVSARVLDAQYFNVPQSRRRIIFIGVRNDLNIQPSHPEAESKPVTMRQATDEGSFDLLALGKHGGEKGSVFDVDKSPSPTIMAKGLHSYKHGTFSSGYNARIKISLDKPSPVIMRAGIYGSSLAQFFLQGDDNDRRHLSIAEIKRFSSYPDPFKFIGDWSVQWERIGNSVPPLFMRSIALHIRSTSLSA